ncbi:uncharacterized protein PAC_16593 [Phialocephala subalpina]|uniref:Uncharacterized protein n=1 Tax=Phialocephala subalpina TaxID=576137 RepID=A0A1L7XNT8_9HELO|nr:uncharacterized protein PAC_16593 [Phialocephala subalpina]
MSAQPPNNSLYIVLYQNFFISLHNNKLGLMQIINPRCTAIYLEVDPSPLATSTISRSVHTDPSLPPKDKIAMQWDFKLKHPVTGKERKLHLGTASWEKMNHCAKFEI